MPRRNRNAHVMPIDPDELATEIRELANELVAVTAQAVVRWLPGQPGRRWRLLPAVQRPDHPIRPQQRRQGGEPRCRTTTAVTTGTTPTSSTASRDGSTTPWPVPCGAGAPNWLIAGTAVAGVAWLSVYLTARGPPSRRPPPSLVTMGLPWTRRFVLARAWCVISRHRLQRLCFETRLHTRSGRLPLILRIHPTKVGERAHIWCRAGICLEDFEAHKGEIRAACYARDARVTRNPRWSQLVTVDIIRHDPLSAWPARAIPDHQNTGTATPGI